MLHAIASAFIGVATLISSLFSGVPAQQDYQPVQETPSLGASLPSSTAVFETSLQSRISSTDTSMTLVANSVRGGSSLSGYQCFTVDEGRTDAEYICGTIAGTSVTSLTRGIDPSTGTTSNSTLKFAHRVGANIKITDFPVVQILRNQAAGIDTYSNLLRYASGVTPAGTGDLTDKEYVDGIAFSGAGVIDASAIAKGVVELATGAEAAASTPTGSSGPLVLAASSASSTYNAATAGNVIPVTSAGGKLDNNFIATSTLFAAPVLGPGTTVFASSTLYATTTTGTWTKPANLKFVIVEVLGSGAGGGGCGATSIRAAGGGATGGYAKKVIPASALPSTVAITVGAPGTGATGANTGNSGNTSSFGSFLSATGGTGGGACGTSATGGTPGTGSGGDLNLTGGLGDGAGASDGTIDMAIGGRGGNSPMGLGQGGAQVVTNGSTSGNAGTGYGSGGSGSGNATNSTTNGGDGTGGLVIITSMFY